MCLTTLLDAFWLNNQIHFISPFKRSKCIYINSKKWRNNPRWMVSTGKDHPLNITNTYVHLLIAGVSVHELGKIRPFPFGVVLKLKASFIVLNFCSRASPTGNWCDEYVGNFTVFVDVPTGEFVTSMTRCNAGRAGCQPHYRWITVVSQCHIK